MAIDAGDAVLRFLGDTSNLDTKFDQLGPNAERAFAPAAEAAEEASEQIQGSMSEARGEVALLGEEFGIRLPRHVRTFIAELPGVGEALSAAFSATAVLFLAQALVQATEKVSNFAANTLIFTQAMKDRDAAMVEENKLLVANADATDKAKDALAKFGATGSDSLRLQAIALQEQIATQKAALPIAEQKAQAERGTVKAYVDQHNWLSLAYDKLASMVTKTKTQVEVLQDVHDANQRNVTDAASELTKLEAQQALLQKQLETEEKLAAIKQGGDNQSAGAKLKAAQAQAEVAEDSQTAEKRKAIAEQLEITLYTIKRDGMMKQLAILKENDDNTKDAQAKLLSEMKVAADNQASVVLERLVKDKDELQKTLQDMAKTVVGVSEDITTPLNAVAGSLLTQRHAADSLGITLRSSLVSAYNQAVAAMEAYKEAGGKDVVVLDAFLKKIQEADKAVINFGNTEENLKKKTDNTFQDLSAQWGKATQVLTNLQFAGTEVFNSLSKNIEGAFEAIVLSQGNIAKEFEKATASALASIAAQAAVKALFYTAEGTAALFTPGLQATAAGYFTAAGEMAAVAAVAGVAGHELAGAGGGSGSRSTAESAEGGNSNTGQSNRSGGGVSGVQQFASGGLVTGPTLALIGEDASAPTEAVLPLDDPEAMGKIREGIGGGGDTHFHINGLVSDDKLVKIMKNMSKLVNSGKATLKASDSLRLTKRSA
jgi:hypothetical protein